MDKPFMYMIGGIVMGMALLCSLPFLFDEQLTKQDAWALIGCFIFIVALIFWFTLDITYEFREDYLFLRAGCLFTRVRYEDIESYRRLTSWTDILSGFNLLSSTKAIEILAPTILLGVVKISPSDLDGFIAELEKRLQQVYRLNK